MYIVCGGFIENSLRKNFFWKTPAKVWSNLNHKVCSFTVVCSISCLGILMRIFQLCVREAKDIVDINFWYCKILPMPRRRESCSYLLCCTIFRSKHHNWVNNTTVSEKHELSAKKTTWTLGKVTNTKVWFCLKVESLHYSAKSTHLLIYIIYPVKIRFKKTWRP